MYSNTDTAKNWTVVNPDGTTWTEEDFRAGSYTATPDMDF